MRALFILVIGLVWAARADAFIQGQSVPPSDLRASLSSFTGIQLTWTSGSGTRFTVLRSTNGGDYVGVGTVSGNSYQDERLQVGTRYSYYISGTESLPNGEVGTGTSNTVELSTPAFLTNDIGAVGATGSTVATSGAIAITGSGADIWGTADAFHFAQESWGGDGTLVVRVNDVQPTAGWAKVGVMFREDLTPGSRYVMAAVNPNGDGALLSRANAGGDSQFKISVYTYTPMWVKLTRTGSSFEAYQSRDGVSWVQIGSVTVDMPLNIYAGLAITSHAAGTLCTAHVDNYSVSRQWNPGVPTAPTYLQSILVSAARTEHRWTDGANATTYEVGRSSDGVHFAVIGSVAPGVQFFADTTVARGTQYSYRVRGRNDSGASLASNVTTLTTPSLSPTGGPTLAMVPASAAADLNGSANFTVTGASAAAGYGWQWNGYHAISTTTATVTINPVTSANAGIYTAFVSDGGLTQQVNAILGLRTTAKTVGGASEYVADVHHPNGNVYDQVLMNGASATITADPGQVTRLSFVNLSNDIVQVEFSGAGALTVVLDTPSGPTAATYYNQPNVAYMKGHPSIVIAGADETTNVSVFSVGRANSGNPGIFRDDVTYNGVASIGFLAISSTNGKFGGVYTANATYFQSRGPTGIYAPGVQFTGPIYLNDINAGVDATPMIILGGANAVRVAGGDMWQANAKAIQVSGITELHFAAGYTSAGTFLPSQTNMGAYEENGADVTSRIVVRDQ